MEKKRGKFAATICGIAITTTLLASTAVIPAASAAPLIVPTGVENIIRDDNRQTIIDVFDGINSYRASQGVPPLKFTAEGSVISQNWSDKMAAGEFFQHNPDFITGMSKGLSGAGENIAARWDRDPVKLVQQWINSPSHRDAMRNPNYKYLGVGITFTDGKAATTPSRYATYATTNFYSFRNGVVPQGAYDHPSDYFSGAAAMPATQWVSSAAPVFNYENNTVTIPEIAGVKYTKETPNGGPEPVAAGTHAVVPGRYVLRAIAQEGYRFDDGLVTQWTVDFEKAIEVVTPLEPVLDQGRQTITIPAINGVYYMIDGSAYSPGEYSFITEVTVEAMPANRFELEGTTQWTFGMNTVEVSVKAPLFDRSAGTYTIPEVEGVQYTADYNDVEPGTYVAYEGPLRIEAFSDPVLPGYVVTGEHVWDFDFTPIEVAPAAPTFNFRGGSYVIPATEGVEYWVDGELKAAGTYPTPNRNITVTATAVRGYQINGGESWSFDFTPTNVTASAPTFNKAAGTYTIPNSEGVTYRVDGTLKSAGTYPGNNKLVAVTAVAQTSYKLTGTASWNFDFAPTQVTLNAPVFNDAAGTYTIPTTTGVQYLVNRGAGPPSTEAATWARPCTSRGTGGSAPPTGLRRAAARTGRRAFPQPAVSPPLLRRLSRAASACPRPRACRAGTARTRGCPRD